MIVIKVGGSLFDNPLLIKGLNHFMNWPSMDGWPYLIVPGGGKAADAVRHWDSVHHFDPDMSHWLAIRAMSLTARLLRALRPMTPVVNHPLDNAGFPDDEIPAVRILDPFEFCQREDVLPHSWEVTSDSIAAQIATAAGATELVLLKSVDMPESMNWQDAAGAGIVDPYFPEMIAVADYKVRLLNFRRYIDDIGR